MSSGQKKPGIGTALLSVITAISLLALTNNAFAYKYCGEAEYTNKPCYEVEIDSAPGHVHVVGGSEYQISVKINTLRNGPSGSTVNYYWVNAAGEVLSSGIISTDTFVALTLPSIQIGYYGIYFEVANDDANPVAFPPQKNGFRSSTFGQLIYKAPIPLRNQQGYFGIIHYEPGYNDPYMPGTAMGYGKNLWSKSHRNSGSTSINVSAWQNSVQAEVESGYIPLPAITGEFWNTNTGVGHAKRTGCRKILTQHTGLPPRSK